MRAPGAHDSVQVAVRVRPLNAMETSEQECVRCISSTQLVLSNRMKKQQRYTFDQVFSSTTSHETIFSRCIRPLVQQFEDGYNVTVFSYGQTGSGKTFSMDGLMSKVLSTLFPNHFQISYLEILNEDVLDLLSSNSSSSPLQVREDGKKGVCVSGLSALEVSSHDQVNRYVELGRKKRTTFGTKMNQNSSRSHAICTLTSTSTGAKLNLVDLAGSERVKKTLTQGVRFQQGVSINRGLLSLGNVISALTDSTKSHVPYRDSKLTRILQDSLGGNSFTLMLACIGPSELNFDETKNTLRYATRALEIRQHIVPRSIDTDRIEQQIQLKAKLLNNKSDPQLLKKYSETNDELSCGYVVDYLITELIRARETDGVVTSTSPSSSSSDDSDYLTTPLRKKRKHKLSLQVEINSLLSNGSSSSCSCSGKCATRACSCKRNGNTCDASSCGCNSTKCINVSE